MNIFNTVQVRRPKYSVFDLSHDLKLSMKMGKLVPCYCQETLPGDRFRMTTEAMFRMMPMVSPIMHKVDVTFHTFFVPNRILWSNWSDFITGGEEGSTAPALPTVAIVDNPASSLANYLGIPVGTGFNVEVNALPFAAYQRIWYEYYRDQNLQENTGINSMIELVDGIQGSTSTALKTLRTRAWEHDYFTSALPWAQKGAPVELPLDLSGLTIEAILPSTSSTGFNPIMRQSTGGLPHGAGPLQTNGSGSTMVGGVGPTNAAYYDPLGSLVVNDNGSANATINDLRTAWSLQKWLEKNARSGNRLSELILSTFGKRTSDARLQRPEYLGGQKGSMAISEVLQTSSSDDTTPQANMAGHGISVNSGNGYTYECEEHGYIITICSILPKTAYYQGLPRHFNKQDRLDFAWPDFAFLGEQEIKNSEVFLGNNAVTNEETWGYIPRYSEYRYNFSRIAGQMATTLEHWHMGRKFSTLPPLNEDFIEADPTKRIFAVEDPDEDEIVAHVYHNIMARRPLPKYGTPGIF